MLWNLGQFPRSCALLEDMMQAMQLHCPGTNEKVPVSARIRTAPHAMHEIYNTPNTRRA